MIIRWLELGEEICFLKEEITAWPETFINGFGLANVNSTGILVADFLVEAIGIIAVPSQQSVEELKVMRTPNRAAKESMIK